MSDSVTETATAAAEQAALLAVVKRNILTPVCIGVFLSCLVCGIALSLTVTYYSRFPTDRLWMKLLVAYLTVSAVIDTGNNASWIYQSGVLYFGNLQVAVQWKTQFTVYLFQTGLTIAVCQAFFLWRCWIVSQRKAIVAVAAGAIAAVAGLVFEWWSGWWVAKHATLLSDFGKIAAESWAFCACQLLSDTIATAVLVNYLVIKPRKELTAGLVKSSPLMKILTHTWATNSASLLLQALVMGLIGLSLNQGSLSYVIPGYLESKVYGISVVAALNSRHTTGDTEELEDSDLALTGRSKGYGARSAVPGHSVHVHVEVEREVERDTELYGGKQASPYAVTFAPASGDDGVSLEEKGIARNY